MMSLCVFGFGSAFMAVVIKPVEASEAERALFKKKVQGLSKFKGRGTELISVYIPQDADRSSVMSQLTEEISQAGNIKSSQTRKNVQGALRKIIGFLKTIDFKIPENGIAVFSGNISEQEGRSDIRIFTVRPLKPLKTKLYWCDSEFHLAPLHEMMQPSDIFALIAMDKNESTIAVLSGKKYEILAKFTSGVAGKTRAGGQSAKRFEHLREEAAQEFYKRVSEKVNAVFLQYGDKLKGIIIGGPGITKQYFLNKDLIDYRLKKKILGQVDTSYTDESGIREIVQKSDELLRDTDLMRERRTINRFLEEVAKGGLAAYGQREIEDALAAGKVSELIVSEGIERPVFKTVCTGCGGVHEEIASGREAKPREKCPNCGSGLEVVEEIDYLDYMLEKAQRTGGEVRVVSTDTAEGKQFFEGFGGIGAMLRYK